MESEWRNFKLWNYSSVSQEVTLQKIGKYICDKKEISQFTVIAFGRRINYRLLISQRKRTGREKEEEEARRRRRRRKS